MVFGSGFPVPTVLNPMIFGSVSLSHCVESHIWSLVWFQSHIWSLVWFQSHIWSLVWFQFHIWSLGLVSLLNPMIFRSVSLSHCVESHIWSLPIYGLWSGFNPIYGLYPYMVFGSGFPVPTVLNPMIFGSVSLSHCVESHIWSLGLVSIPYMVFGSGFPSGFPVPTVLNPMIFGSVSLSHCVESHIWSLGPVSIPYMVFGSGFPVPTVLNPMVFGSSFPVPTVLILYMVFGSGFNPIYGLWVRFPCPNCVK